MIIVASKPGQLGNRLFVFANLIASALENNFALSNPSFDEYCAYFPGTERDLFCRYPSRQSFIKASPRLRRLLYWMAYYSGRVVAKSGIKSQTLRTVSIDWDDVLNLNDPAFKDSLKARQITFLQGWQFRDVAALNKHAATIRQFFQPRKEHSANVNDLVTRAREDSDILAGVHIRHGYIDSESHRQYWYPPAKYAEMMREFAALFPGKRVKFLICSDVKQDHSVFAEFEFIFGNHHELEDMYAFAQCDYIFGPPSTYTMWASFFGDVPLRLVTDTNRPLSLGDFTSSRENWQPANR